MAYTPTGATLHVHEPLANHLFDVGIFKDTLLPTLGYSSALAVLNYGLGRSTDALVTKDVFRPAYHIFNLWWSAVFRRVWHMNLPVGQVLRMQSRPERLLLGGVTLWAGYRVASAEYSWYQQANNSTDDPKYSTLKQEEGFWNKALFTYYLPEAAVATIVALPFTAPFRHQGAVMSGYHPILQSTAVGLYTAGFALEVLADYQSKAQNTSASTDRDSIWSVLSNPKNLASTAVLSSFPLLLYSSDMLAPIELLGPIAYYLFHRYTYSSATPEDDIESAKSTAKDVKEGRVDYKAEAEDAKDEAAKIVQNKSFLTVLAIGVVTGILEGFTHGSALRFGD